MNYSYQNTSNMVGRVNRDWGIIMMRAPFPKYHGIFIQRITENEHALVKAFPRRYQKTSSFVTSSLSLHQSSVPQLTGDRHDNIA